MGKDTLAKLADDEGDDITGGYLEWNPNGLTEPVIRLNPNLTAEEVEEVLYHETEHARQYKKAKEALKNGDSSLMDEMVKFAEDLEHGKMTYEEYEKHPLEAAANVNMDKLKRIKEEYNGKQNNTGTNRQNQQYDEVQVGGGLSNNEVRTTRNGQGGSSQTSLRNSETETQLNNYRTNAENRYEQSVLDFNSVEDVAESVVKGDLKNMPEESLDVVVDDIVNKNYNYDKTTWEEFLNNVEAITDPVIKQVLDTFNYEQVLRFAGNPDKFIV